MVGPKTEENIRTSARPIGNKYEELGHTNLHKSIHFIIDTWRYGYFARVEPDSVQCFRAAITPLTLTDLIRIN